jgi:hypothetical protein
VESSYTPICIFINHGTIIGIVKQKSIETKNIEWSNLLLIRASNYFQSFNLKIIYKLGIEHIVLDVFSRLQATKSQKLIVTTELDFDYISAYNFIISLYNISPKFCKKLEAGYKSDPI